jgi:hypothetical protein
MKSTKQNAVKADYHTTDWPYQFVLAFKTVHYSAQHFLNFFVKQHHHRSRYWQNNNKFGISSSKIKTTTNTAAASAHTERMELGRGLKQLVMPRPLPKLLEMVEGTPPPTTTTTKTRM